MHKLAAASPPSSVTTAHRGAHAAQWNFKL